MGAPFWSAEEREYFLNEILPLSQYPNGVYTSGGQDFAALASIMQAELDRRGQSKRQYTGKKLFQHYYQRVGEVAQKRESKGANAQTPGASTAGTPSKPKLAQSRPNSSQPPSPLSAIWPKVYRVERVDPGKILYADVATQTELDCSVKAILTAPEENGEPILNANPLPQANTLGHRIQTLGSSSGPPYCQTPCSSGRPIQALAQTPASRQDQIPYSSLPPPEIGIFQRTTLPKSQDSAHPIHKVSCLSDKAPVTQKRKASAKARAKKQQAVEASEEHAVFGPCALANSEVAAKVTATPPLSTRTPPIDRLLNHFAEPAKMGFTRKSRFATTSPIHSQNFKPEEPRHTLTAIAPAPYSRESMAKMGQKRKRAFIGNDDGEDEGETQLAAVRKNAPSFSAPGNIKEGTGIEQIANGHEGANELN